MNYVAQFAHHEDVEEWMQLVDMVEDSFPNLDKEEYRKTLANCIEKKEAICAKHHGKIVGILLFSVEFSILAFIAVHPDFRRCGIASVMIKYLKKVFPLGKDIWVTTYRENDPIGKAARTLYLQCGFKPDDLVIEMDYPCQKFVLHR